MISRTLNEALKALKGRFILSLNDRPEVRQIFSGFEIETVDCTYSILGWRGQEGEGGGDLWFTGLVGPRSLIRCIIELHNLIALICFYRNNGLCQKAGDRW
jgi:hypothetical protein